MNRYSVLMSVYKKETAQNLRESVKSMMNQTIPPDDFVLYCDGTLTDELYREIERLKLKYQVLHVVYCDVALGLGKALNNAMGYCKNDIIARMDSDDIAKPERMECQLEAFIKYSADIVSAEVEEFVNTTNNIISVKKLPEKDEDIKLYSKRRNPFNHPCTCFRKHQVYMAGGYQDFPFFEDYYLWIRMLSAGCKGYNIQKPLLYMRSGKDMYNRRGGFKYTSFALRFRKKMYKMNYCSLADFIISSLGHAAVGLLPGGLRMKIYSKVLRQHRTKTT